MNIVNSKINKIQNYIVLDKNKQIYYKGDIRKCLTFVFDKAYYDNIKDGMISYQLDDDVTHNNITNDKTFGKCLYLDGEKQLCENEEHLYHETIVHVAGAYIKKIENVLIIGGGDCMTLREVMKYNTIKNVTMIHKSF